MAPAVVQRLPSGDHIGKIARAVSSTFTSLSHRAADATKPPLASLFTLAISHSGLIPKRAISASQGTGSASIAGIAVAPLPIVKRQSAILAIPATYAGLNAGPAPGAVVGIILGSVAGFILCLYILLFSFQFMGNRTTTVIKEEVITTRHQSRSRSRSKHTVMTERSPQRQPSRRETIIIEERVRVPPRERSYSPPDEVVVEEDQSISEDIVEVIEEQSTASPPSPPPEPERRERRRSGFRTINPAEPGGGDAPLRRVKKR